jgi:hypothetical protein
MYPTSKPPNAKPRFHGPFIIVKKLDKGAVIVRLHDGSPREVDKGAILSRTAYD